MADGYTHAATPNSETTTTVNPKSMNSQTTATSSRYGKDGNTVFDGSDGSELTKMPIPANDTDGD